MNFNKTKRYLKANGYLSSEQRWTVINSIRTDIPNVRLANHKFLFGAVRLYLQGQLSDGHSIHELNNTLKYIASDAHVNEYDNNLNNESLQVLVNRFKGVAKDDLRQSMEASNKRQLTVNQDYTIVPINNFEDASKYGRYTSWCITHDENMLNSYTRNGAGRFYFCLRNGFENELEVKGEGSPLDSYGLSMIAVSVDMEGAVNTITCRWNHDMGGNDSVMTVEELETLLGRNFYQTFKPYTREELHAKGVVMFDEVQALLDSGKKPEDIFDYATERTDGFIHVNLNGKWNCINTDGKIISDVWFDNAYSFREGKCFVKINGKWNLINTEGKIVGDTWFDDMSFHISDFFIVVLNNKMNFINKKYKIISDVWFDYTSDFIEGFAYVKLNGKWNFINTEGKIISDIWFDDVSGFKDGFARVKLNGKRNFINTEGKIISNTWFDNVSGFKDGFARVKLNGKHNFINTTGRLVNDTWTIEC